MIWHDHVSADPCSMRRAFLSETQKGFVNCWRRQNIATVLRASGKEVKRRMYEDKIEPTQTAFPNFGAHRAPLQYVALTAFVCCEGFEPSWVNSLAHASNEATPLLRGWKREMRTSATVTETVFLTQLTKETAKDSEWGKG